MCQLCRSNRTPKAIKRFIALPRFRNKRAMNHLDHKIAKAKLLSQPKKWTLDFLTYNKNTEK